MHPRPPKAPSPLCLRSSGGHSCLSLSRPNSPQLFQLFLSNSIYNKLCLNFCLSDNNNNTIIIWSITYSQLYLIKAVISLRVSGNRVNRKSCTTRTSQWGLHLNRSEVTAVAAPEARGHQQGPASGVWVLPPWSHTEGGSAVASGQRRSLEPLKTHTRIPSDLGRPVGRLFPSRLGNRGLGNREDTSQERGRGLTRPRVWDEGEGYFLLRVDRPTDSVSTICLVLIVCLALCRTPGLKTPGLCSAENLIEQENSLIFRSQEEPSRRGLDNTLAKGASAPQGQSDNLNPGPAPISWACLFPPLGFTLPPVTWE